MPCFHEISISEADYEDPEEAVAPWALVDSFPFICVARLDNVHNGIPTQVVKSRFEALVNANIPVRELSVVKVMTGIRITCAVRSRDSGYTLGNILRRRVRSLVSDDCYNRPHKLAFAFYVQD